MRNKICTLFLLLAVSQDYVGFHVDGWETGVEMYKDAGPCKNSIGVTYINSPGLGLTTCVYYTGSLHDEISAIRFAKGSCAKLYDDSSCTSTTLARVTYSNFGSCAQPLNWNDRINAVGSCKVTSMTKTCPSGSFVRSLYIPQSDDLVSGITMHCFQPSSSASDSPTAYVNSVGAGSQSSANRVCSYPWGARGISLNYHGTFQYFYSSQSLTELICGQGSSTSELSCGQNQVLTGFTSDVEEISGVTKGLRAVCMDVKDPTLSCTPTEFGSLVTISTCENTGGNSSKTCTISLKLGWGDPDSDRFSDAERNEKAFYTAYFGTASTPKNLLSRFRIIGNSKIDGVTFNWGEHGTRSWSPLQTKSVIVSVPAGTLSTFQQLKGKCSFYGVHTSYVKRIDVTGSKRTETIYMSGLM